MAIQSGWAAHNAGIAVFTSTRATKYPSPAAPDGSRTASVTGDSDRAWVALRCSVVMSRSLIELRSGTDGIGSEMASGLRSSLVIERPPYAPGRVDLRRDGTAGDRHLVAGSCCPRNDG